MAIVEVTATFVGHGSQISRPTAVYEAASAMTAGTTASGTASLLSGAVSTMCGASAMAGNAALNLIDSVGMDGASAFSAGIELDLNVIAALSGNSAVTIDPTKTTIRSFRRGLQAPSTALPLTLPTFRFVPPAPRHVSYSGAPASNRNRRREDR